MKARRGIFVGAAIIVTLAAVLALAIPHISRHVQQSIHPMKYRDTVETIAAEYDVPPAIVLAVIKTESSFDPKAVSHAGARGLMQLMPDTDLWLSLYYIDTDESYDIFDPETNIRFGVCYLSIAYKRYGDWKTAWASYNAGISRVDAWLEDSRYSDDGKTLKHIPYPETAEYVEKVGKAAEKYSELYYGGNIKPPSYCEKEGEQNDERTSKAADL